MIEWVLVIWITVPATSSSHGWYVTTPTEVGVYRELDSCELQRDLLIDTTKNDKGAVTATCVERDK